jgi:hypothetical protein
MNYCYSKLQALLPRKKIHNEPYLEEPKLSLILPCKMEDYAEEEEKDDKINPLFILKSLKPMLAYTSFRTTKNYYKIFKIISILLFPYKSIHDSLDQIWLIEIDNCVIRISVFEIDSSIRVLEFSSIDKNSMFWQIYHLAKRQLNDVDDSDKEWISKTYDSSF